MSEGSYRLLGFIRFWRIGGAGNLDALKSLNHIISERSPSPSPPAPHFPHPIPQLGANSNHALASERTNHVLRVASRSFMCARACG